ncbi:hypothetical protein [Afifella marina]|uniref:Uncharacterized protein n=1 Tax=Afifella marina DSM 2698 TaxID=1120955 RepID=A0A1G5M624_AFIMA|nr:hypothetical protein [Afifella marina]MBK1622919.1 hypothetical protein [Afifella marina DSM 2698]MBK1625914.1 hypothetical protein [Afifella marina]MBK5917738.1 hypothetical protein [Afifella marina]RAI23652.1 hypothetical protein CH311_01915 [Afifella marina DSM 2698]SCZ20647.1 hypothetical protein SAMN03080610_00166 [Afifella marina DSM 2698]
MDGGLTDTEQKLRTQANSFEEIISHAATAPIDTIEIAGIKGAVKQWLGDGYRIGVTTAAWRLDVEYGSEGSPLASAIEAGWIPFLAADIEGNLFECRLVKFQAGRSLFGSRKYRYRLYRSTDAGHFIFLSEHRSSMKALWGLNKMLAGI